MTFDVVSDVHGEFEHLISALLDAGYALSEEGVERMPADTTLIFLGDLVDNGPNSAAVLSFVMTSAKRFPGRVRMVMGNHDEKLLRYLKGNPVTPFDPKTIQDIQARGDSFCEEALSFLSSIPYTLTIPYGERTLLIAHACPYGDSKDVHMYGPNGYGDRILWWNDEDFLAQHHKPGDIVLFGHYRQGVIAPELRPDPQEGFICLDFTPDTPITLVRVPPRV